jgi:hypothetical protein
MATDDPCIRAFYTWQLTNLTVWNWFAAPYCMPLGFLHPFVASHESGHSTCNKPGPTYFTCNALFSALTRRRRRWGLTFPARFGVPPTSLLSRDRSRNPRGDASAMPPCLFPCDQDDDSRGEDEWVRFHLFVASSPQRQSVSSVLAEFTGIPLNALHLHGLPIHHRNDVLLFFSSRISFPGLSFQKPLFLYGISYVS